MSEIELGALEIIDPKEVWESEARDFTPWLLENPSVLAKAIGLDIVLRSNEFPVGTFSLDLIGDVPGTQDIVIVENQLTPSDHTHLGQLLTYAGGTGAKYVVWVAPKFREEHIAAIERLNDTSTDSCNYFAVEVSVVRIGESARAPLFQLVSGPNGWSREMKATVGSGSHSELNQVQLKFWAKFLEVVKARHPNWTNASQALAQNWLNLPAGNSGFWYCVAFTKSEMRSEFIMGTSNRELNAARYNLLLGNKADIENSVGMPLDWHLPDGNLQAIVRIKALGNILEEDKWDEAIDWFIGAQENLRTAISPFTIELQSIKN